MSVNPRALVMVAGWVTVPVLLFAAGLVFGLRFNLSPSYPLGLWRIVPLNRPAEVGDRVFICPPLNARFSQARERGYVGRGLCPGWMSPLIKTIVAGPGQTVTVGASLIIDGRRFDHSALQPTDGAGRALTHFAGGTVPSGSVFLHSPYRGSYDSRYFGPVPLAGLLGLAAPVLAVSP